MPFVNLEGWVIIGPGSEWFWTAVSGIVLAVTLVGLYLRLRMQRAAPAIEQIETLDREFDSEECADEPVDVEVMGTPCLHPCVVQLLEPTTFLWEHRRFPASRVAIVTGVRVFP